jgi:hypothetical protein
MSQYAVLGQCTVDGISRYRDNDDDDDDDDIFNVNWRPTGH